ncbi:MAG: hypothetical protein WAN65_17305 [Candidatus Sulfotelmatobacter sp.]
MAPERIELPSGVGVEGPEPFSTPQALHGQSATSSGEERIKDEKTSRAVESRQPTSYPSSAVGKLRTRIANQKLRDGNNKSRQTIGRHIALIVSPEKLTDESSRGAT